MDNSPRTTDEGDGAPICTSVCTPLDAATIEGAIARLTAAIGTAADDVLPDLVAELRALRADLRTLREGEAGVVHLDDARALRERER